MSEESSVEVKIPDDDLKKIQEIAMASMRELADCWENNVYDKGEEIKEAMTKKMLMSIGYKK